MESTCLLYTSPVLDNYMAEWGLKIERDLVIDQQSYYRSPLFPFAQYADHEITESLSSSASFVSPYSSSVTRVFDSKNNYTTFPLLQTTEEAYAKTLGADAKIDTYEKAEGDKTGQMNLGAGSSKLVDGTNKVVYSYMFAFGSTDVARDVYKRQLFCGNRRR